MSSEIFSEKIIYQGKEWVDCLHISTAVSVSIWGRIKNLFCPTIQFEHLLYTDIVVPAHKVEPKIRSVSYYRLWQAKRRTKHGYMHNMTIECVSRDYSKKIDE